MNPDDVLIDAMFARHGIPGPWKPLPATGLANRIYATRDVVLRVATDHKEAVADARTESVAAPVAHAAGILTPRLIAFDDSRDVVDRPFSIWERVHGETLGCLDLSQRLRAEVWREVGRELSRLHHRVRDCPDPQGYLDEPARELSLDSSLAELADSGRISGVLLKETERLLDELRPHVTPLVVTRFIHYDVHPMNVMCTHEGALLALIDWGDAGFGDPTLDFAGIPLDAIPHALAGYESQTPGSLGDFPKARFVWDFVSGALEDALEGEELRLPLHEFRAFL